MDEKKDLSSEHITARWENQAELPQEGEIVFAHGLGEVMHGQYIEMGKHQMVGVKGLRFEPLVDEHGKPIMCQSTTGTISVVRPKNKSAYVSVVCVTSKNSKGQCHVTKRYPIQEQSE